MHEVATLKEKVEIHTHNCWFDLLEEYLDVYKQNLATFDCIMEEYPCIKNNGKLYEILQYTRRNELYTLDLAKLRIKIFREDTVLAKEGKPKDTIMIESLTYDI
jgi:hypothetical protein